MTSQPSFKPAYLEMQRQINMYIDRYLAKEQLRDRLEDLPVQFATPHVRSWKPIDWQAVSSEQVVGLDLDVFLAILKGAMDTEAPIRHYTQTSRKYLEQLHPNMARFVGGTVNDNDVLLEPGLWEKEERQHTPALLKIYTQLTGEKADLNPHQVRAYQPSNNPYQDLYRHGLHRIATEYGATCLYLWLMAHTTGTIQAVLEELLQDEINHMTKFWGFGVWAYPETSLMRVGQTLLQTAKGKVRYSRDRSSLLGTLHRMTQVLAWQSWTWTNRATFIYTCARSLHRISQWNTDLTPDYLQTLFGAQQNRNDQSYALRR